MTDTMQIRQSETGLVRLFTLNLPEAEARDLSDALAAGEPAAETRLRDLLGAEVIEPTQVEVFPVENLEGLGVSGYLEQGHAIPAAELDAHRGTLDALSGWLVVVPTRAFRSTAQTLKPASALRWIGTFAETPAAPAGPPLHSAAAEGVVGPAGPEAAPAPRQRVPYGWLIAICLVILALGLVLLGVGV